MMTVAMAVKRFLLACEADGLADRTVGWYRANLGGLMEYLGDARLVEVSCDDLRGFIAGLRGRTMLYVDHATRPPVEGQLSAATVDGYVRTVRRFFSWVEAEGLVESSPAVRLRMAPRSEAVPRGISREDLERLLAVTVGEDVVHRRDRAVVLFLADTGCRAGEVCGLRVRDVYLDAGVALVRGKGGKERLVAFCSLTREAVGRWLEVRWSSGGDSLFCGERGPLTVSGLGQLMRRLGKRAGVEGACNPHSFRHGFAREYLMNGGDLASLSELLGHSDLQVTKLYSVFRIQELQSMHEAHGPLARLVAKRGGAGGDWRTDAISVSQN